MPNSNGDCEVLLRNCISNMEIELKPVECPQGLTKATKISLADIASLGTAFASFLDSLFSENFKREKGLIMLKKNLETISYIYFNRKSGQTGVRWKS